MMEAITAEEEMELETGGGVRGGGEGQHTREAKSERK